jgi:hypothetical protein
LRESLYFARTRNIYFNRIFYGFLMKTDLSLLNMNSLKLFSIPLILVLLLSANHAALLHKRDTLHILSSFGREVSFLPSNTFKVDSIKPGLHQYPCSLSHTGIFFASLSVFPTCPCCPSWAIASARPFFKSARRDINWSSILDLKDSTKFIKIDTSGQSYNQCLLPTAHDLSPYIFSNTTGSTNTTYLLVNVMKAYTDLKKPTISEGGDLGYPVETCVNMLVVDMWLQTDGTTNFQGVQLVSTYSNPKTQSRQTTVVSFTEAPHQHVYDLKGRCISFSTKRKSSDVPQGCYFIKDGLHLKRVVLITP